MTIYDAAVRQSSVRRQRLLRGQKRTSRITLPAPLKGLNTRAPVNQLGPDEAYVLTNFVPDATGLRLREGSTRVQAATGVGKLMTWSYQGNDNVLWSYASGTGYTLRTLDGLVVDPSTLNGTDWSVAMMNGLLGMVNGQDFPRVFAGSIYPGTLSNMTISGPSNTAALTGIKVFKSRSYFWSATELGFWYSSVNALGGALTWFPLETVSQRGGAVMSINAWSQDAGSGPDDFFVVTTTKGEVLVYQGSNPNDPNDWAIIGRFQIGIPIDKNAFLEVDGRIYVLTQTDLEVLPDKFVRQQSLSRLSGAIRQNYADYGSSGRYALFYDPVRDRILLNIPTASGYDQLVKTSFGYTRFTGINAIHYAMYNDEVYFVTSSGLFRWGGARDRVGGEAADITFSAKTGYGMLGGNGEKRVAMYRPNLRSSGSTTITSALDFDHRGVYLPTQTITETGDTTTPWGSPWGSPWDQPSGDRGEWLVGVGTGQSISMSLSGSSATGDLEWMGNDFELAPGGMY